MTELLEKPTINTIADSELPQDMGYEIRDTKSKLWLGSARRSYWGGGDSGEECLRSETEIGDAPVMVGIRETLSICTKKWPRQTMSLRR